MNKAGYIYIYMCVCVCVCVLVRVCVCVTSFFSDIFPSDRTMALGSTQPLVKMSTRNIFWG